MRNAVMSELDWRRKWMEPLGRSLRRMVRLGTWELIKGTAGEGLSVCSPQARIIDSFSVSRSMSNLEKAPGDLTSVGWPCAFPL